MLEQLNIIATITENKFKWYFRKIDATHVAMAMELNLLFTSKAAIYHVDQLPDNMKQDVIDWIDSNL